MYVFLNFMDRR